ncbi:MAG: extracellular solute-binding protein [Actinomycetota bacterium]|nr:extracellular solute-binding protein [Actinomycetota bacterium]
MSKLKTLGGAQRLRHGTTRGLAVAMAAAALSAGVVITGAQTANASRRLSANIQMWIAGNNTTKPIYEAEAAAFSKSHPGITVTITDLPGPAYTQKLDTALAANQLPAIFQEYSPGPALQQLVRSKQVVDLTPYVKRHSVITRRILQSALAQGQIHGQQYGIPYNIFQETVILYNKADFRKADISGPPQTWSQLNTDIGKLKAAGIIPVSISGTESDNWYELWLENYEVRHSGLGVTNALEKGKSAALGTAPVVEAARAMQQLVKAKAFEPGYSTISEANDVPYALLGTGKAGMLLYGAFTPNFVNEAVPNFSASGNMGWFSFPSVSGGKDNAVIDLASQPQLVVNAHMSKEDIKAAEEFLASFVYSPGQVAALSKTGNVGPFANSLYLVKQRAPKDLKSYMLFELKEAQQRSSFISWSQLLPPAQTTNWNNLLEELFSLAITPSQFAAQAAKL